MSSHRPHIAAIARSFAVALGLVLVASQASAVTIKFTPSATTVAVNDIVTLDVEISDLGPEILRGFDVDLLFDSTVFSNFAVTHSAVPHFGGIGNSTFDANFGIGRTEVIDASLLADADLLGQLDAFTILTFSFQAIGNGFSILEFGPLASDRSFTGLNGLPLDVTFDSACIAVGPDAQCPAVAVSEPAIALLFGVGLLGVALGRRFKRTA